MEKLWHVKSRSPVLTLFWSLKLIIIISAMLVLFYSLFLSALDIYTQYSHTRTLFNYLICLISVLKCICQPFEKCNKNKVYYYNKLHYSWIKSIIQDFINFAPLNVPSLAFSSSFNCISGSSSAHGIFGLHRDNNDDVNWAKSATEVCEMWLKALEKASKCTLS